MLVPRLGFCALIVFERYRSGERLFGIQWRWTYIIEDLELAVTPSPTLRSDPRGGVANVPAAPRRALRLR